MERAVERYLKDRVKQAGGLAVKLVSPGFNGMPDRLVLMPGGRVYFAETKDTGKKPTRRQPRVHEILRGLGFKVYVPDSKTSVDCMMREVTQDGVHGA